MTVHRSPPDSAGSTFAPHAVYTILHADTLRKIASRKRPQALTAKRRWVTGAILFNEARRKGQDMVILYADAKHCSKLLYWGRITALSVSDDGTNFSVAALTPVSRRRTQDLVLRSNNKCIAKGFIKPYAIVETPSYIDNHAAAGNVRLGK